MLTLVWALLLFVVQGIPEPRKTNRVLVHTFIVKTNTMLTECPECKKVISDQATSCPHCGYVTQRTDSQYNPFPQGEGCFLQVMNILTLLILALILDLAGILNWYISLIIIFVIVWKFFRKKSRRVRQSENTSENNGNTPSSYYMTKKIVILVGILILIIMLSGFIDEYFIN